MNYLVTNLYDNPRKLYKYFPISKEYAIKVVDNGKYVGLMFAPNLSREDASSVGKVIDKVGSKEEQKAIHEIKKELIKKGYSP